MFQRNLKPQIYFLLSLTTSKLLVSALIFYKHIYRYLLQYLCKHVFLNLHDIAIFCTKFTLYISDFFN